MPANKSGNSVGISGDNWAKINGLAKILGIANQDLANRILNEWFQEHEKKIQEAVS